VDKAKLKAEKRKYIYTFRETIKQINSNILNRNKEEFSQVLFYFNKV
jgi:hypothetical protein